MLNKLSLGCLKIEVEEMNLRTGKNSDSFLGAKRRDDFFESFEFIGVWCVSGVVLASSWFDYQFFGVQPFWILWRGLFPFFAVALDIFLKMGYFGRRSEIAHIAMAAYNWAMLGHYFVEAGLRESPYSNGFVQVLLALSIFPFSYFAFSFLLSIAVLVPLILTLVFFGSVGINSNCKEHGSMLCSQL
jgi:hypothetical protein